VTEERLAAPPESRLRRARRHRNWTLARVVQEIDKRMPGSGVTESLVSAWELGKRKTSLRYREVLCAIYGMPPEELFADQDRPDGSLALVAGSDSTPHAVRLLPSYDELLGTLEEVVRGAHHCLVAAGSRSRDIPYLAEIERVVEERPRLVHYRLLFGPPRWQPLKDHLVRLLELRDPDSWEQGTKTLHIGICEDPWEPARFFCASERRAVVMLPSLTTAGNFDCGVLLLDPSDAQGLVQHGKQVYPGMRKLESIDAVRQLRVLQ
jgi:transcriptional regulator with XRE-family HTH domain